MLFSNERGRWREGDRSNDEEAKGNLKRTREQKLVYLLIARGHEITWNETLPNAIFNHLSEYGSQGIDRVS
jgi:hypothetical protein